MKTIDLTPTWVAACKIYFLALEHGSEEGKKAARADILKLAAAMDKINEQNKKK